MSSNIEVNRICQYCNKAFTARTTVTKYCSLKCSQRAYKERKRDEKIQTSSKEVSRIIAQPIEAIKAKEFLTVREVAQLLNCSTRSAYNYIEKGKIKAVNLGERMTRIKRSEIDLIFNPLQQNESLKTSTNGFNLNQFYSVTEVLNKFKISESALQNIIKRENLLRVKKGKFTYIPKREIENILN
jgi:excisionase family DNA binding protein